MANSRIENELRPRPRVTPERRRQRHESRTGTTFRAFLNDVCEYSHLPLDEAERTTLSVICTLEQRITANEARDLEAQLPLRLRELLQRCPAHASAKPERFSLDEFIARVADDLDCTEDEAESRIEAVFAALRDQISEGEFEDVGSQLPSDIADLWYRAGDFRLARNERPGGTP